MDEANRAWCARTLSQWLRHRPDRAGITLSPEGWATIDEVVGAFERLECTVVDSDIVAIVASDPKHRFEIEGDRIRARYGHSVQLAIPAHESAPPSVLFYTTVQRYVPKILVTGLLPIKRQFVHMRADRKAAREEAASRGKDSVIIMVSAADAFAAGVRFFPRGAGVWLSEAVPAQFLQAEERPAPSHASRPKPRQAPAPAEPEFGPGHLPNRVGLSGRALPDRKLRRPAAPRRRRKP